MGDLIAFLKRYFHVLVFVALQVLSIIMLYQSMTYPRYALAAVTRTITAPVNKMCFAVIRHFNFSAENQQLVEQNLRLLQERDENFLSSCDSTLTAEEVVEDTATHRTTRTKLYDYTTANVVYNTINKKNNYIIIDKGSEDGIVCDMAILSAQGVVGVVTDVAPHFSTVTSLLNSKSRISAKVMPTNQLGTIAWHGGDPASAYLEDVPEHLSINFGDSIYTSGYSDIFPNNVLIGVISGKGKQSGSSFLTLKVKLATDFNHINTVYVVRNLYKEEFDDLKANMQDE